MSLSNAGIDSDSKHLFMKIKGDGRKPTHNEKKRAVSN